MSLKHTALLCPELMVTLAVLDALALLQQSLVRLETQCLGRHSQYVVLLESEDSDVGRKTRFQFQVVVGCGDNHLVCHDVTLCGSILTHLCHSPLKLIIWEGIHGEAHPLSFLYPTDVCLIDVCDDAHVSKVLCDDEELRGVE